MKRRLRHALMWISLAVTLAAIVSGWLANQDHGADRAAIPETARPRPTVVLDPEEWTAYRIPSTATRVKLLSRANLSGFEATLIDREFSYEIDYQLESLTGQIVSQGRFALQTKLVPMEDSAGIPRRPALLRQPDLIPAAGKASTLEVAPGEILVLKLRGRGLDPSVADVSLRAFLREEIPDRKLAYQWSRLSDTSRARIGRPRIHMLVDLRPEERRASLRNRWRPMGPQGVAGRDFTERLVYLRDDLVPVKRRLIEPLGLGEIRCSESRRAIIGIPPPGGQVRLEFRRVEEGPPAHLTIRYFGETIHERSSHQHLLDAPLTEFTTRFGTGMLEIESPQHVAIRPFWKVEGQLEQLLEPEPSLVRTWRAGPEESVEFALGGNRTEGGFFRLSARALGSAHATLHYELLSAGGSIVRVGAREIAAVPSLYDLLLTPDGEAPVNDPIDVMLELPAGVAGLRLRAESKMLLAGYTRPAGLPHRTRVPADYVRALPDPDRLPIWFGLRPVHADELIRAHRSFLVHTQVRPPEDDADILAGRYQWEDYQPVERARGQYLLSQRDPASPSRDEALPSLFMPLAVGKPQPLALEHPPGFDLPSRRLAFVRQGREPVTLRILIDDRLLLERRLVTERGELLVPPIQPGSEEILIECSATGLRCCLNYVQPAKATVLKRLAQRVSPGESHVFLCAKESREEELLTGMFFAPPDSSGEAEIHVAIRAGEGGEFRSGAETLTLRDRIYLVTPDQELQTPVLGGPILTVDGGRRFFIPFGSDLEPGTYEVTITLKQGLEGYLTLSKVTGGNFSDARFFREASR